MPYSANAYRSAEVNEPASLDFSADSANSSVE